MQPEEILKEFKALLNPKNIEGMRRFGINSAQMYGINIPVLRKMAKSIGKDTELALELWETGIHEAQILASMVAKPSEISENLMEKWVKDFDSWGICDQVCTNLFRKTGFAYKKIFEWAEREEEYVKRAGFVMMTVYALDNKNLDDETANSFFALIKSKARDERNFVKKAVNWALRQIGKNNLRLNKLAIRCAEELLQEQPDFRSAKWIAKNALNELKSKAVQERLKAKTMQK